MSTISTTISTNIYYGTGQTYPSPLTITSTGAVIASSPGAIAVKGSGGGTLINDGSIIASGNVSIGVEIVSPGGSVDNSGLIQGGVRGLYIQGVGYVANYGTILSTSSASPSAVELTGGGSLFNSGVILGQTASGDGVRMDATGATVVNTGLIRGYGESLGMEQAGTVINSGVIQLTGTTGSDAAVFQGRGGGTLVNQGTGTIISAATGGNGVLLDFAGGSITNGGLIRAYDFGVYMEAGGFITNTGTILSTGANGRAAVEISNVTNGIGTVFNAGTIFANGFAQSGIQIVGSGDTVTNSGSIQGYFIGIEMSGPGVIINSGRIHALSTGFAGEADVIMPNGGNFTNMASGYIDHGVFLNVDNDGVGADATAVNAGTIFGGLYLNAEQGGGGAEFAGTGTIFDSGTIHGSPFAIYLGGTNALLVLQSGYSFGGVVEAGGNDPHTLELMSNPASPVTVNFNTNEFRNFGTAGFAAGSNNAGTLALAASGDVPGTIVGFTAVHDVIDLQYISDTGDNATAILNPINDQLTVTGDNGSQVLQLDPSEDYTGLTFSAIPDAAATGTDISPVICFCRGTQILLERGEAPIETLKIGDCVRLFDGRTAPIAWIGRGKALATGGQRSAATPVIVRKDALGDNMPNRDLHITKAHSLYIDDVLIPVEFLVNHRSILWDDRAQEVEIYHVELETHDVLIANGTPSESYRDDGNRWLFRNGNENWDRPPQPACAPVLTGGPIVDAIWRRLLDRSGPPAQLPLTDDPDLHLLVDGQRLNPTRHANGTHVFRLAGPPETARVISRSAAPQELGLARDPRRLGVALRRIDVRQGTKLRIIEADDTRLDQGFHAFEEDNEFLWTNGDATLPAEIFAGFTGPLVVELTVAATTRYPDEANQRLVA
ncbi:Hint domain-containing protein [Acidisphaera sp. S103]|uniref:Hint domain-containing protein n=1 Tax=Acidisphaera sp. S103 TaxID=1747223 RepID=UPI00131CC067|nr:Hint domain-containing protein [Acidisphaera sp. S103]